MTVSFAQGEGEEAARTPSKSATVCDFGLDRPNKVYLFSRATPTTHIALYGAFRKKFVDI